jgi:hypothetical protein
MSQAMPKYTKKWTLAVHHVTTIASGFSRNNPSTKLRDHYPLQVYLQLTEQHLYSCGVSHICIGEIMSSPSQ